MGLVGARLTRPQCIHILIMCILSRYTVICHLLHAAYIQLHQPKCNNDSEQPQFRLIPGGLLSCVSELKHYMTPYRLHEALDLVKEMARSHRYMQAATLNSLVRALAPSSAARALRMVSFMTTLGLPTYHITSIALIGACARQHMSAEALDLYWYAALCVSNSMRMALAFHKSSGLTMCT